jgi:beta-galactosidase
LLAKLAGVEIEDWTSVDPEESRAARLVDGREIALTTFVERLRATTARPIGRWLAGDLLLSDAPAVTVNKFGKGKVYYIGGYCPAPAIETIIDHLIASKDLSIPLAAPAEVEIIHRVAGKTRYVIALNHSSSPQRISGPVIEGDLVLSGFDVAVIRLQARRTKSAE